MNTPAARNSDPITSHLSDRYITESGIRVKQTPFEVIHKRLSECQNVKKGGIVRCSITGRPASIWVMR